MSTEDSNEAAAGPGRDGQGLTWDPVENASAFSTGSQVRNAFWAGWVTSWPRALK